MRSKLKLPSKLPEWICKCIWASTAAHIKVAAKDENEAWHVAWKKVARTEGGDSCLVVRVIRKV